MLVSRAREERLHYYQQKAVVHSRAGHYQRVGGGSNVRDEGSTAIFNEVAAYAASKAAVVSLSARMPWSGPRKALR